MCEIRPITISPMVLLAHSATPFCWSLALKECCLWTPCSAQKSSISLDMYSPTLVLPEGLDVMLSLILSPGLEPLKLGEEGKTLISGEMLEMRMPAALKDLFIQSMYSYARDNHPELRHHEDILYLVNPEAIVRATELGKLVQADVRHVENDGWVMGWMDGLW